MDHAALSADKFAALADPRLKQKLQELRQADNVTNLYYLARTYALLALTLGGAVWFSVYRESAGLSFWWNVPVMAAAVVMVGALQHQLSGLGHDASHHVLFKNRYLNELASDWLCMFPMFSSTHHYRLQHLAHHQFVNDPLRDPDVAQLRTSGHWDHFPLARPEAWRMLLGQLWVPNLIRFMGVRARYNMMGTETNPYVRKGWRPARWPAWAAVGYVVAQIATLRTLMWLGDPLWMAVGSAVLWGVMAAGFLRLPERYFYQSRLQPTISFRTTTIARLTYLTLLVNALAWTTFLTGRVAAVYFAVLWLAPLFTSYAFFMVLRQSVQHGNGDRGMLTNTRVFSMSRLVEFCVFPMGQQYHLPHHMFSTVPHFRLAQLHEALLEYPEYREQAVVVENYFLPRHQPPSRPTVVDVLGPLYAPRRFTGVYIDNSVLDASQVDEKNEILREGESEVERLQNLANGNSTLAELTL